MIRLALLRLLESFFRHWWLYVLPIIIAGAASGYFAYNEKPQYTSGGTLYVQGETLVATLNDLPGNGGSMWLTPADIFVNEVSALLGTELFLRPIVAGTPLEVELNVMPEDLGKAINGIQRKLWVYKISDNMVAFGASADDSQVALRLASRLPEKYVQWKLDSDRQDSIAAQDFFKELLTPRQKELDDARTALQEYLKVHEAPERGPRSELEQLEITQLQTRVSAAEQRVQELLTKDESAELAQVQAERNLRQTYMIVDAPKQPGKPTNGMRARLLENSIFLLVGVALSVIGIIGAAVIDPSLRFPIDVNNRLHLPVLAMPPRSRVKYAPATQSEASDSEAEEYRADRPSLAQQPFGGQLAQSSQE